MHVSVDKFLPVVGLNEAVFVTLVNLAKRFEAYLISTLLVPWMVLIQLGYQIHYHWKPPTSIVERACSLCNSQLKEDRNSSSVGNHPCTMHRWVDLLLWPGLAFKYIPVAIAGNFRGVQFSRKASLQTFRGLIFADSHTHAYYTLHNRAYFAGLIFTDNRLSAKTAKIGPHENFSLYGT